MKFVPVLALGLAACAGNVLVERPDPVPAADLAGRFEQHAFFSEAEDGEFPLARFEDRVVFDIRFSDPNRVTEFAPEIGTMIDQMGELTGRSVDLDRTRATVFLAMHDRAGNIRFAKSDFRNFPNNFGQRLVEMARRATCGAQLFGENGGPITGAVIFLPIDLDDDHLRRCIVQEIAQSFGLPNDVADPDGTVFSSGSRRTTLSETDRRLIQILYDDRLASGMTRAEAMPIVRRIITEKGW